MKKVVVGMSGGVDSSVTAILLQQQGYEVIGVTFVFTEDFDATDAIKVCKKLDIKHRIIDYKKEFEETVINKFISDYNNGITPNPCVLCNRYIKFKFLYKAMQDLNCDYMATGHYAKVIDNKLYKSADLNKDQTYFLCEITKEQLSKVLFPLEGIEKSKVREIALKYNLINVNKKDSTDVCFITSKFKKYMTNKTNSECGPVINILTKEIIGTHNGLNRYTIGQRKGLGIGGTAERMFVVGKNIDKNILYVCLGENSDYLISDACVIDSVNWLSDEKLNHCTAKFRYRQQDNEVDLEWLSENEILVKYPQGVKAVTPGQTCVFYNGEECLGGGIIKDVLKNNKKLWYL